MQKKSEKASLPIELFELICGYLPSMFKTFRLVSKTWKNLIDSSYLLFEKAPFQRIPNYTSYPLPSVEGLDLIYHADIVLFQENYYLITFSHEQRENTVTVFKVNPQFSETSKFQLRRTNHQTMLVRDTTYVRNSTLYAILKLTPQGRASTEAEVLQSCDLITGKIARTLTLENSSIALEATQQGILTTYHASAPYYQQWSFMDEKILETPSLSPIQLNLLTLLDQLNLSIQFFMLRIEYGQFITIDTQNQIQIWNEKGNSIACFNNIAEAEEDSTSVKKSILCYAENAEQQFNVVVSHYYPKSKDNTLMLYRYDLNRLIAKPGIVLWQRTLPPNNQEQFTAKIEEGYIIAKQEACREVSIAKIFHPTRDNQPLMTINTNIQGTRFLSYCSNKAEHQLMVLKQKSVGFITQDHQEKTSRTISLLDYSFVSIFPSQRFIKHSSNKKPSPPKHSTCLMQ